MMRESRRRERRREHRFPHRARCASSPSNFSFPFLVASQRKEAAVMSHRHGSLYTGTAAADCSFTHPCVVVVAMPLHPSASVYVRLCNNNTTTPSPEQPLCLQWSALLEMVLLNMRSRPLARPELLSAVDRPTVSRVCLCHALMPLRRVCASIRARHSRASQEQGGEPL